MKNKSEHPCNPFSVCRDAISDVMSIHDDKNREVKNPRREGSRRETEKSSIAKFQCPFTIEEAPLSLKITSSVARNTSPGRQALRSWYRARRRDIRGRKKRVRRPLFFQCLSATTTPFSSRVKREQSVENEEIFLSFFLGLLFRKTHNSRSVSFLSTSTRWRA